MKPTNKSDLKMSSPLQVSKIEFSQPKKMIKKRFKSRGINYGWYSMPISNRTARNRKIQSSNNTASIHHKFWNEITKWSPEKKGKI